MPDDVRARLEDEATQLAGERAGGYLDTLGKTDLASLTVEEWQTFLSSVIVGYRESMRAGVEELYADVVPF